MSAEQTGSSLVDLLRSYRDRLQQRFEYSIEQPPSAEPEGARTGLLAGVTARLQSFANLLRRNRCLDPPFLSRDTFDEEQWTEEYAKEELVEIIRRKWAGLNLYFDEHLTWKLLDRLDPKSWVAVLHSVLCKHIQTRNLLDDALNYGEPSDAEVIYLRDILIPDEDRAAFSDKLNSFRRKSKLQTGGYWEKRDILRRLCAFCVDAGIILVYIGQAGDSSSADKRYHNDFNDMIKSADILTGGANDGGLTTAKLGLVKVVYAIAVGILGEETYTWAGFQAAGIHRARPIASTKGLNPWEIDYFEAMCIEFWGVTNVSQGTRLAPALTSAIAGKLDGGPDIWKHIRIIADSPNEAMVNGDLEKAIYLPRKFFERLAAMLKAPGFELQLSDIVDIWRADGVVSNFAYHVHASTKSWPKIAEADKARVRAILGDSDVLGLLICGAPAYAGLRMLLREDGDEEMPETLEPGASGELSYKGRTIAWGFCEHWGSLRPGCLMSPVQATAIWEGIGTATFGVFGRVAFAVRDAAAALA